MLVPTPLARRYDVGHLTRSAHAEPLFISVYLRSYEEKNLLERAYYPPPCLPAPWTKEPFEVSVQEAPISSPKRSKMFFLFILKWLCTAVRDRGDHG